MLLNNINEQMAIDAIITKRHCLSWYNKNIFLIKKGTLQQLYAITMFLLLILANSLCSRHQQFV